MAADKVRVGIIGAGQIGTKHMQRYSQMPDVEIVGVSDLFPERIERACRDFDIPDGCADFADLLAREDVDAVDVCVHNNKHAPITIAALEAGKHVFCEKPMAGSYPDALAMIETARRCKLNPFTFFSIRSDMPQAATFDLDGSNTRWHSCFAETSAYDSPQHHWIAVLRERVPLLPTAGVALNTSSSAAASISRLNWDGK